MIVDPDYPIHWKTVALVARFGPGAAMYPIKLWAHCQSRRKWIFPLAPYSLAGIVGYAGDADELWAAFTDDVAGWLVPAGDEWEARGFADRNRQLVHNWKVGPRGGRPRKNPRDNPRDTPRANPMLTQGVTEKRREELSRETQEGKLVKDRWNKLAQSHGIPLVRSVTGERLKKYKRRVLSDGGFWDILEQELRLFNFDELTFLCFDWLVNSDTNWNKFAEGNYRRRQGTSTTDATAARMAARYSS